MIKFTQGKRRVTSSTHIANINPLRYRGYYYDTETKFYYVNTRYYYPDIKRMLNADDSAIVAVSLETLTDKNSYAYCDNNPVLRADDEGNVWHVVVGAAIGAVTNSVDSVVNVVSTYKNGGDTTKAWLNLGISFVSGAINGGVAIGASPAVAKGVDIGLTIIANSINAYYDYRTGESIETVVPNLVAGSVVDILSSQVTNYVGDKVGDKVTSSMTKQGNKLIKKGSTRQRLLSRKPRTANVEKGLKIAQSKISRGKNILKKADLIKSSVTSVISTAINFIKGFFKK